MIRGILRHGSLVDVEGVVPCLIVETVRWQSVGNGVSRLISVALSMPLQPPAPMVPVAHLGRTISTEDVRRLEDDDE